MEYVTKSVPGCNTVELASLFVYSVVAALVEGKAAVTAPAATTKGAGFISSSWYVDVVGRCVPSVAVQTASVVPESTQVPERVLGKVYVSPDSRTYMFLNIRYWWCLPWMAGAGGIISPHDFRRTLYYCVGSRESTTTQIRVWCFCANIAQNGCVNFRGDCVLRFAIEYICCCTAVLNTHVSAVHCPGTPWALLLIRLLMPLHLVNLLEIPSLDPLGVPI